MNVLSSIAPLELSQEAKSPWIQFVICFTLSFLCIFFAYSIWTKSIVGKKEELLNGLIEYQKKDSLYSSNLREYEKLFSIVTNESSKCLIRSKISDIEFLKCENLIKKEVIDRYIEFYGKQSAKIYTVLIVLFFFIVCFVYLQILLIIKILKIEYLNSKSYPYCESCGRALNRILMNYGTERNGQISQCFCIDCYQNGKFVFPSITLDEMEKRVQKEMESKCYSKKQIERRLKKLHKLKRWKLATRY